jgi:hypothetical protein
MRTKPTLWLEDHPNLGDARPERLGLADQPPEDEASDVPSGGAICG